VGPPLSALVGPPGSPPLGSPSDPCWSVAPPGQPPGRDTPFVCSIEHLDIGEYASDNVDWPSLSQLSALRSIRVPTYTEPANLKLLARMFPRLEELDLSCVLHEYLMEEVARDLLYVVRQGFPHLRRLLIRSDLPRSWVRARGVEGVEGVEGVDLGGAALLDSPCARYPSP
jgi:hypothetical protein